MKPLLTSARALMPRAFQIHHALPATLCAAVAIFASGCGDDSPSGPASEPARGFAPFTMDDKRVALVDNGTGPAGVRFDFERAAVVRYTSAVEEQTGTYTYQTNNLNAGRAFLNFPNATAYFGNNAQLDLAFTAENQGLATVYSVGASTNQTTIVEQTTFLLSSTMTNTPAQ